MIRKIICLSIVGILFISLAASGQYSSKNRMWLLTPFWNTSTMKGESLFFIREDPGQPACASLLFSPDKIISVMSATEETVFEEGRDYLMESGSRIITLTENSRIPDKTSEEMYPPKGSPQSINGYRGTDKNLFFSEGHVFHDLQVSVTYTHRGSWKGYVPKFSGGILTAIIDKLKKQREINLLLFGDSISSGANASGVTNAPPFMPHFGELLKLNLEAVYGAKINFKNFSVGGKTSEWGLNNIWKIIRENPDLVIIAFGMNDASRRLSPEKFASNIQTMIDAVRMSKPDAEFILVATMTGNEEWKYSSPELYPAYRDAMKKICTGGIVLADMTTMWTELLKHKKFADITGNGVNHPNDFAHRIYASVLLSLLVELN